MPPAPPPSSPASTTSAGSSPAPSTAPTGCRSKAQIDSIFEGVGAVNGPLPAALDDWALPIAQVGDGAKLYTHSVAEAKRLLAAAGHPNGFPASICFATYGSTQLVVHMHLAIKQLKDVGIDANL